MIQIFHVIRLTFTVGGCGSRDFLRLTLPYCTSLARGEICLRLRFSDPQQIREGCQAAACVLVTVKNIGQAPGEEVVQAHGELFCFQRVVWLAWKSKELIRF